MIRANAVQTTRVPLARVYSMDTHAHIHSPIHTYTLTHAHTYFLTHARAYTNERTHTQLIHTWSHVYVHITTHTYAFAIQEENK